MKPEIEDGMGFSGLAPTRAELEQDRRDQAERERMKALEARVTVLEAALREVRAVLQSDSVEYDDISALMVMIDEALP